jgi:dolichol-phosphate mannosyltransferase
MKTLVAIPCFRCEKQIGRVLEALTQDAVFSQITQIVVLDNQSPDRTRHVVLNFIEDHPKIQNISLYLNEKNYGLGGSQKLAVEMAIRDGFESLVVLHGDDQASVKDLAPLLHALQADPEIAAVLGSRFMQGSRLQGYQKSRIIGNRALNIIFSAATGTPIRDLGSGLNVFRVRDLADIPLDVLSDGFTFNVDLLLEFYSRNKKMLFLPIEWREADQSSNARNWNVALGMLKRLALWRTGRSRSVPPQNRKTHPVTRATLP